ncbi:MAG: MbnP family protein, partial [Prosthecobacter sp.]
MQTALSCAALALTSVVAPLEAATLQLVFNHHAGANPLLLDSLRYRNQSGEDWSVTRLSYLISGVSLQREDGSWFNAPNSVAWMNAATRRQMMRQTEIPEGKYQALRFHIGIDPKDNAADPSTRAADHPLNPNLCGLHWSWQGGYIFMALEGLHRAGNGQPQGYAYHLARDPFLTEVTLKLSLDIRQDLVIPIVFDVAAVLDSVKNISFAKD